MAPHSEFASSQQVYSPTQIQNGNPTQYTELFRSRPVGSVDRSKGRIPSHPGTPKGSGVPMFFIPATTFSFRSDAIRPLNSTPNLHESNENPRGLSASKGHPDFYVHRRLGWWWRTRKARCHADTLTVVHDSQNLGWIINPAKSNFTPTQTPVFLGAQLDLRVGLVYQTRERQEALIQGVRVLSHRQSAPARAWLVLLGYMASMVDLISYCRLRMRPIQWHLLSFFRPSSHLYQTLVPITEVIHPHLLWWSREQNLSVGTRFPRPSPDVTLTTDASLTGWGAYIGEATASGRWQAPWNTLHINRLELEAVSRALIHFSNLVTGRRVLVRTDNTTVVAYINKQWGTHSFPLWRQSWLLFQCAIREGVSLQATHLPGILNIRADILSRQGQVQTTFEWQLNPLVFQQILNRC